MTLNDSILQSIARKKERAEVERVVLVAINKVYEHYQGLSLSVAAEAVARCREAVQEAIEKKGDKS